MASSQVLLFPFGNRSVSFSPNAIANMAAFGWRFTVSFKQHFLRMPHLRYYVGPSWPPPITAYDYVLALCPSDLAWEFLRRNPDYQRDYRLSRRGWQHTHRLRSGHRFTRIRRHTRRSIAWGLHPFRRPGAAGSRSTRLLADQSGRSNSGGHMRPSSHRSVSRHLSG
jgi:hypothetical protein